MSPPRDRDLASTWRSGVFRSQQRNRSLDRRRMCGTTGARWDRFCWYTGRLVSLPKVIQSVRCCVQDTRTCRSTPLHWGVGFLRPLANVSLSERADMESGPGCDNTPSAPCEFVFFGDLPCVCAHRRPQLQARALAPTMLPTEPPPFSHHWMEGCRGRMVSQCFPVDTEKSKYCLQVLFKARSTCIRGLK